MKEHLPNYLNFEQLMEGYTVENAMDDDCVVFVDSKLVSGEDVWEIFMTMVGNDQSCCVRIARYYSIEDNLCLIDVSYKDASFRVNTSEGLSEEYKYLNHYEIAPQNSGSEYSMIDCYILVNQENVAYEEIEKSMISSILGDALDHYIVYYNLVSL